MARPLSRRETSVKRQLEEYYSLYHKPEYLMGDPLRVAHQFSHPDDQEVTALLAAAFASGNIKSILALLDKLLAVLGPHPAQWLRKHSPGKLRGRFPGIYHRWVQEKDIEVLLALIGETLRKHNTLGELWRHLDDPSEADTTSTLEKFVQEILAQPIRPLRRRRREMRRADGRTVPLASVESILLTPPSRGSACKRMHLFLRWVVRPKDGIDLGLWSDFVSPTRLLMPVDTHVLRLSRELKLTKRKQPDRKSSEEITAKLKRLSPDDPCRYDFVLVRAGIGA